MHIPQIIFLTLTAVDLLVSAHEHGKPRKPLNFWNAFIGGAISVGLLVWGGFFNH